MEMTARQWISMVIQRLTGWAQDWAAAVWSAGGLLTTEYEAFMNFGRYSMTPITDSLVPKSCSAAWRQNMQSVS